MSKQKPQEIEARRWSELEAVAARCVEISERVWDGRLAAAIQAQRQLAETLRDRPYVEERGELTVTYSGSIPVPIFTPRDRMQFLKEFATTLLISADRRNLTVTPEGPAVIPFGPGKGRPLTELSSDDLAAARDWALSKKLYPDFIEEANLELMARQTKSADIQTQPLDEKPLALVEDP